jgi:hypothetical protein
LSLAFHAPIWFWRKLSVEREALARLSLWAKRAVSCARGLSCASASLDWSS